MAVLKSLAYAGGVVLVAGAVFVIAPTVLILAMLGDLALALARLALRLIAWAGYQSLLARSITIGEHRYFVAPFVDGPDAFVRLD